MKMKKVNGIQRCRLCAGEEDFNNFKRIFDDDTESDLEMKITKLLPVVVMPWDPMPHVVCHACICKLNTFNEFYESCIKADKLLKALHFSTSSNQSENVSPAVEILGLPILNNKNNNSLKKRQASSSTSGKCQNASKYVEDRLKCFIINNITNRDSVYTCRKCFRTFTRKKSALSHSCMRLENCDEFEGLGVKEEGVDIKVTGKPLPPLKIRLFSVRSGLHVCYLCQSQFKKKVDVVEHIREHFADGQWGTGSVRRPRSGGGRRKSRQYNASTDDDWEESYRINALKRKRKSFSETSSKKTNDNDDLLPENLKGKCEKCGHCDKNSRENVPPVTQTAEQTKQFLVAEGAPKDFPDVEKEKKGEEPPPLENDSKGKDRLAADYVYSDEERPPAVQVLPVSPVGNPEEKGEENRDDSLAVVNLSGDGGDDPVMISEPSIIEPVSDPAIIEPANDSTRMSQSPEVDIVDDPVEISQSTDADIKVDEITVLEVININKSPFSFLSCVFCDKIFSTRSALSSHHNRHLSGFDKLSPRGKGREMNNPKPKPVSPAAAEENYLCSSCAMMFTSEKTLLEHEQYHVTDSENTNKQRRIRIALNQEFESPAENERPMTQGRGLIRITVTTGEKEIPQIELI